MIKEIIGILAQEGIEFIYAPQRMAQNVFHDVEKDFPYIHLEVATNEKIAYELAFSASIVKKRSAFLTNTHSLLHALDPIMSSTYMGVLGAMVVLVLRDTEEDVTYLGPFAKIPFVVEGEEKNFPQAIGFGIYISEKFGIPVIVELDLTCLKGEIKVEKKLTEKRADPAQFVKETRRWAATPSLRYSLHVLLNEKIRKIREEFELYQGNVSKINGETGFLTYRKKAVDLFARDLSYFVLSTVYPLPSRLVSTFMEKVSEVFIISDPYSVIQFQLESYREKLRPSYEEEALQKRTYKKEEVVYGYLVLRDTLGPASSMNMAHAIKKLNPDERVLALTYEDNFFHSGLAAFINTLYNGSDYHLLILTEKREAEIINFMEALNFKNYHFIRDFDELKFYAEKKGFTVLILGGKI